MVIAIDRDRNRRRSDASVCCSVLTGYVDLTFRVVAESMSITIIDLNSIQVLIRWLVGRCHASCS
jgi:hypothetical protein